MLTIGLRFSNLSQNIAIPDLQSAILRLLKHCRFSYIQNKEKMFFTAWAKNCPSYRLLISIITAANWHTLRLSAFQPRVVVLDNLSLREKSHALFY